MKKIQIIIEPYTANPSAPAVVGTAGLVSTTIFNLPSPESRLELDNTNGYLGASPTSSDMRNWQQLLLPSDIDEDKQQEHNRQTTPSRQTPAHLLQTEPSLLPSLGILANRTYLPKVRNTPKGITLPPPVLPRGITLPEPVRAKANPNPRVCQNNSATKRPLHFHASSRINTPTQPRPLYRPIFRPL